MCRLTVVLILTLIVVSVADAKTFYVSKNGSDKNNGLKSRNAFLTIRKAAQSAKNNDVVIVDSGTYADAVDVTGKTKKQQLVFQVAQSATVVISGPVKIVNSNNIVFNGFQFAVPSDRAVVTQDAFDCTFINCRFTGGRQPLLLQDGSLTFDQCDLSDFTNSGIQVDGDSKLHLNQSRISRCRSHAIEVSKNSTVLIDDSEIIDNGGNGIHVEDGDGQGPVTGTCDCSGTTPKSLKEDAYNLLGTINPSTTLYRQAIADARIAIRNSLANAYWQDAWHTTLASGPTVYRNSKDAIDKLNAVYTDDISFFISGNEVVVNQPFKLDAQVLGVELPSYSVTTKIKVGNKVYEPWGAFNNPDSGDVNDKNNPREFSSPDTHPASTSIGITGRSWRKQGRSYSEHLTVDSTSQSANLIVLRDGDAVPDIKGAGGQKSVAQYVGPYVDASNRIDLEKNQAIFLYELYTTDLKSTFADFQDLVMLVSLYPVQDNTGVTDEEADVILQAMTLLLEADAALANCAISDAYCINGDPTILETAEEFYDQGLRDTTNGNRSQASLDFFAAWEAAQKAAVNPKPNSVAGKKNNANRPAGWKTPSQPEIEITGSKFNGNDAGVMFVTSGTFASKVSDYSRNKTWGLSLQETNTLKNCTIDSNGIGGVWLANTSTSQSSVKDLSLTNNRTFGLFAKDSDLAFDPNELKQWNISGSEYIIAGHGSDLSFDRTTVSGGSKAAVRLVAGNLEASKSTFSDSSDGLSLEDSTALLKNCVFAGNATGLVTLKGNITLSDCELTNNDVGMNSSQHTDLLVERSIFSGNKDWAGRLTAPGKLVGCSIIENTSNGLYIGESPEKGVLDLIDSTVRKNTGYGVYAMSGDLKITKTSRNATSVVTENGYGIRTQYGTTLLDGIDCVDNAEWGALTYYGNVTVRNCTFSGNGTGGLQSYYNQSFNAASSTFTKNGTWGVSYRSDGKYYGKVDGDWDWVTGATKGTFVDCAIVDNVLHGMYLANTTDEWIAMINTPIQGNPGHGLYAELCDLKFTNGSAGSKWQITNNGHGITSHYGKLLFDGVTISNNSGWGVLSYSDDVVVQNSVFTGNGSGGLHSHYAKSFVAKNSKFNANGSWGFYCYNDGRYYSEQDGEWAWREGAAPTKIANCDFSNNTSHGIGFNSIKTDRIEMTNSQATENGGIGIYFVNSTFNLSPATSGSWVSRNNLDGFYASKSNLTVTDLKVADNSRWGMRTYDSNVSLKNSTFSGNGHNMLWNSSPWDNGWDDKLTVDNCVFENSTEHHGLLTYYGPVEIKNSVFRNNAGDGLYTSYNKSVKVENSVMTGNGRWGVVYHVNYPQEDEWAHKALFNSNVQTLSGCSVDGNYQGIYVYNADQNQFDVTNTSITNNAYQSVYYNRCNLLVDHSAARMTIANNGYGPYTVGGSNIAFRNVAVQNSQYYGFLNSQSSVSLTNCVSTGSVSGYYQHLPTQTTVLTSNRFEGSTSNGNGWGILSYGGSVNATNNVFSGFYSGAYLYTYGTEATVPVHDLYNNTLVNLTYWGVYAPNGSANIHNNVITNLASIGGDPAGYGIGQGDAQLTHSHNLIHGFTAPFYRTTDPNDTTIVKNPQFANAAVGDYHLGKGSPAINAGMDTSVMVPYDMEGNARPSFKVVEIGAYEYANSDGAFRVVEWKEKK